MLDLIEESLRELALVTVTNEIEVDLLAVEHHLRGARQMMLAALCPAGGT